jgi:PDZ domain-containing protein
VPGEPRNGDRGGEAGVYMVDILVRKANLFERLFPQIYDGARLVPDDQVNPAGLSERERRRQSLQEMSTSQQIAIAVALRVLGHDVPSRGAEVVAVLDGWPADGKLEPGDVIVAAKGRKVTSPESLRAVLRGHRPGEPVAIRRLRDGVEDELDVGTRAAEDERRALMGVTVQPQLEFPVDVRIDAGDIGGPSAGLAFALDVIDELGAEVDGGRRIAVTGALALNGRVLPVGGVAQKTLGARQVDADAFVVPATNAAEARRYAEGLEIVPVSSFREALRALRAVVPPSRTGARGGARPRRSRRRTRSCTRGEPRARPPSRRRTRGRPRT